ncbi:MAG: hypothetical protein EOP22_18455 [Hyphomicrobiales bacterium]|nr:MAG: hypothetical protein EOP22_18455 [Hyphomicrobiales bacterium]
MPRVIVKVRKAVRRLARRPDEDIEPTGAETEAQWQEMLYRIAEANRESERRLAAAERALNGSSLN